MKFLSKALKYILILLLLLVLLGALTALSWYEGWPVFTGAAAVLGIAALYLVWRGLLALWRWRDKRAFVAKVASGSPKAEAEVAGGSVRSAWNQGMSCILNSPSRFSRRFGASQPWFIAVGKEAGVETPFDGFGRRLPEGEAPLRWHFLGSCVLLSLSCGDERTWESELEELLAARRRSAPLRGVVLTLRAPELEAMSDFEADALGQDLRGRLHQIMMTANALYPVYILVEEIESLPGMGALLSRCLPDGPEGALGGWSACAPGGRAAEAAAGKLETFLLDGAARGAAPHGDMLTALRRLRGLAPKLDILTENLSRELSHQVNPEIAGVFFCASRPSGRGEHRRPAFAGEFVSRVLLAAPQPRPFTGIPVGAGGKTALMAGWLLLTLSFCGLTAANTIYQYRILSDDPHAAESRYGRESAGVLAGAGGDMSETYARLYSEMTYIQKLERAHESWYLPKMGEDMLGRALAGVKRDYVSDVNRLILRPMTDQFRAILAAPSTPQTRARDMDLAIELAWLSAALADRLGQSGLDAAALHGASDDAGSFPLTRLNEKEWTPVTGQLIINSLRWTESEDQLSAIAAEMRSLLVQSFTRRGSNLLNDLTAQLNSSHSTENVRLSQFWRHIPIQSDADAQVEFCYTAAGRKAVRDTIEDIEDIAGGSGVLSVYLENFRSEYLLNYAKAWEDFARRFTEAGPSLRNEKFEFYSDYEKITKVSDLPHVKVYRRIMAESAPLRESRVSPPWVGRMQQVDAVVAMALANSESKGKTRLWNMFSAVESNPGLLTQLRSGVKSEAKVGDLVKAEADMRSFFENCGTLLGTVSNPSSAFSLCSAKFGREKGAEHPEAKPYDDAALSFGEAFALIDEEWSPAREVLGGILDFIAAEATAETAQLIQRRWEDEVLNSPTVLYGRGGGEAIFGETGVVPLFVQNNLGDLLSHRGGAPVPSEWNGAQFPFDDGFLQMLVEGASAASQPLPPERKDSFRVHISSRPPIVNAGARLRPSMVTLTLEGEDGPQQLVNQNYPQEAAFTYSPEKSGRVTLVISFPGFDMTREYGSFKEFVTDFRMGEKTFFAMDFPSVSDKLDAAEVKTVKVPVIVSNTSGIFDDAKAAAPKYPELPANITRLVTRR
ncbi:type VI secretion protein IcmF/TssM N-terminal domain-containing protein [Cloacibacillus sp. An23]|uniref:type VI secretion protein IcmF/TssM N-terminal domain-containing protein n=1 Tax=Cloacibacillus sp. An23 TaxID=1965591 RepID=UPI000B3AB4FF|nr:type VI secretion protein IcmF/TssM N-terminal domain-containing protein [Cloacibacillus sp. An23]OUO93840.1 hypothetical protein B5F39_06575 [Cloacibacillus sp. An23]